MHWLGADSVLASPLGDVPFLLKPHVWREAQRRKEQVWSHLHDGWNSLLRLSLVAREERSLEVFAAQGLGSFEWQWELASLQLWYHLSMERPRDPSLSRCNADRLLRLTCVDLQYLRKLQEMVGKFKHKIGPK